MKTHLTKRKLTNAELAALIAEQLMSSPIWTIIGDDIEARRLVIMTSYIRRTLDEAREERSP